MYLAQVMKKVLKNVILECDSSQSFSIWLSRTYLVDIIEILTLVNRLKVHAEQTKGAV
jgi:hypothetical protein